MAFFFARVLLLVLLMSKRLVERKIDVIRFLVVVVRHVLEHVLHRKQALLYLLLRFVGRVLQEPFSLCLLKPPLLSYVKQLEVIKCALKLLAVVEWTASGVLPGTAAEGVVSGGLADL